MIGTTTPTSQEEDLSRVLNSLNMAVSKVSSTLLVSLSPGSKSILPLPTDFPRIYTYFPETTPDALENRLLPLHRNPPPPKTIHPNPQRHPIRRPARLHRPNLLPRALKRPPLIPLRLHALVPEIPDLDDPVPLGAQTR